MQVGSVAVRFVPRHRRTVHGLRPRTVVPRHPLAPAEEEGGAVIDLSRLEADVEGNKIVNVNNRKRRKTHA